MKLCYPILQIKKKKVQGGWATLPMVGQFVNDSKFKPRSIWLQSMCSFQEFLSLPLLSPQPCSSVMTLSHLATETFNWHSLSFQGTGLRQTTEDTVYPWQGTNLHIFLDHFPEGSIKQAKSTSSNRPPPMCHWPTFDYSLTGAVVKTGVTDTQIPEGSTREGTFVALLPQSPVSLGKSLHVLDSHQ